MGKTISIPIIDLAVPSGKRFFEAMRKERGAGDAAAARTVEKIILDVREKGDKALFAYTKKFDAVTLTEKNV